jgi:hypothetical protein
MTSPKERPLPLVNASLQYAPTNEQGVMFLFHDIAKRLRLRVEEIRTRYPDCIAYQHIGNKEKRVRIEFEFRSSSFKTHRHDPAKCDWIVCWHHDDHTISRRIRVIELKQYHGAHLKVWIQPAQKDQQVELDEHSKLSWALSKHSTEGDLLLMYRASPLCGITDVFRRVSTDLERGEAGWRPGKANFAEIQRICKLDSPIFWEDLKTHPRLKTSSFVRANMQGNHHVSAYWPDLYQMLFDRNSKARKILSRFAPENL